MKISPPNVKFPPHIHLGFVGKNKTDFKDRDFKIKAWAPKRAKSYTIISQRFEKYGPGVAGHVEVAYFSRKDEGTHLLSS